MRVMPRLAWSCAMLGMDELDVGEISDYLHLKKKDRPPVTVHASDETRHMSDESRDSVSECRVTLRYCNFILATIALLYSYSILCNGTNTKTEQRWNYLYFERLSFRNSYGIR